MSIKSNSGDAPIIERSANHTYGITLKQFHQLYEETEFAPNSRPGRMRNGEIDFKNSVVRTGFKPIYFDCLSEDEFIEWYNQTNQQ